MTLPPLSAPERPLAAAWLAHFATRRNRCERYLRFRLFKSEAAALSRRYDLPFEPLSPLLSGEGNAYESEVVARLRAEGAVVVDLDHADDRAFTEAVRAQEAGRVFYYQPFLKGRIGGWDAEGRADLIEIVKEAEGGAASTIIDIKASRREAVNFRLQVAFYARLLRPALSGAGIGISALDGAIIARGAARAGEKLYAPFELQLYDDEIERLAGAEDSDVARVVAGSFEAARYHLSPKCDGCPYNALCFVETAERDDLSLVPHLTAVDKRALEAEGIRDPRALSGLMNYGREGMEPAPGREEEVARVAMRWPLGGRLPQLVQRARAAVRMTEGGLEYRPYLLGADFGTMPCRTQYPDLVRVFVDAQWDYIADRLYLIATQVAGPDRTEEIIEMTSGVPETESERALLVGWLRRVLPAIARVSGSAHAPVHIYLYDRRGQRALLDALVRHFDALCAIPAFYDLLTSTPALTQSMVSFLDEEIAARRNLAPICQNLYRAARALGFDWEEEGLQFWRRFRARVFDYQRSFTRDRQTRLLRPAAKQEPGAFYVESAARFGTQIPLEYAYAAWGELRETPRMDEATRAELRGFRGVTADEIRMLAAHRCRALRHLEEQFARQNRRIEKPALDLSRLDRVEEDPESVPLARALVDFLILEHYARHQELLLHLAQPAGLRAQTGRTAILRCESVGDGQTPIAFTFASAAGEAGLIDPRVLHLRAGDWVVLNPLADDAARAISSDRLVRGRLAIIEQLDESRLALVPLNLTFRNSRFRYAHRLFDPAPGSLYTIDEMADDLNADKYLEACRHSGQNHLYRWLSDEGAGKSARSVRPSRIRRGRSLIELAPRPLTGAQSRVVGDHYLDRVLVVQGPPGTGKSYTLGAAILARALAFETAARPLRIAVTARTHAATSIILESVASRLAELREMHGADARLAPLDPLRIIKICNDLTETVPAGVEAIRAAGSADQTAHAQWDQLLHEPMVVIGGTPGGLYNLVKRGGGEIDWSAEIFDLVVVDEASQMGIAEALTAAAFLREDGQFIAVGDHRQMPPILAHAWDRESRRDLARVRPHLSIFEYLIEREYARVALDESFRVPAEVADFLRRRVYARDGIEYRSQNRTRLARAPGLDGWLAAALAPDQAFVLIEHDEEGSQQANDYEAGLVAELARVGVEKLGLEAEEGIGVVVPHRAQKALIGARLGALGSCVDTVERFQGGERDLIIVSGTVSDREFAEAERDFLLEPRRLTVALSRPRRKLILVAARTVFNLLTDDLDQYERGALWKHLRHECGAHLLWEGEVGGHRLRVRALDSNPPHPT
jgi:hypothetical protein